MVAVTQLVREVPRMGRKMRYPKHRFQIEAKPYVIQPFVIAPVLPGDTLVSAAFQSRVVTDPIKNPLVGWHQEYYFFYVKLTDLEIRSSIPDLFMTEGYNSSGLNRAADVKTYHAGGGIDWTYECLRRTVAEYFRDEGEAWNVAASLLDAMPMAQAFGREDGWTDSLIYDDEAPEAPAATDDIGELYGEQYAKWQHMAKLKLTNLTFPEWLEKVYGVNQPSAAHEAHRPELIRFVRDWSYPSNTVDPATGTPSSAVSWSIAERITKQRFFREPGFIFGVTLTRPKVYLKNQTGSATQLMKSGDTWLPSIVLAEEPFASVVNVPSATGPIPGITDDGGYWVDLKDLLLYGEQFVNFALSATDKSLVSLPTTGLTGGSTKYVTSADIDALFKTGTSNKVRQDGRVDFRIKSRIEDTTGKVIPATAALTV